VDVLFTEQQQKVVDDINEFLTSSRQIFSLQGYAGTGKTTVMTSMAKSHTDWKLCAFTGKAASVLANKSSLPAGTIHSLFYRFTGNETDIITGLLAPKFTKLHSKDSLLNSVILLDESSMINQEMASDLILSGAKIITSGDPMQLPPVVGIGAFTAQDAMLTEVHRHAWDSAVLRQATAVRIGLDYSNDGSDFKVVGNISNDDLLAADAILCWRNTTRAGLNANVRKLRGFSGDPKAGEPILCLKNVKAFGLFNGEIYKLAEDFNKKKGTITIDRNGIIIKIPQSGFITSSQTLSQFDPLSKLRTAFDFGYAITCHKAQGSSWKKVVIIDEYTRDDRTRWIYTAITRASNSIIVQRCFTCASLWRK
jgi:exodeoxyribonuclease-5